MDEFKKLVGLNLINPKTDQKTSTQTLRNFARENLAEGFQYKRLGNGRIVFSPEAVSMFFARSLVKTETKKKQEDNFKDYIFFASRVQEKLNDMHRAGLIAKKVRWAYTRKLVADILKIAKKNNKPIPPTEYGFLGVANMVSDRANALLPDEKKKRELDKKALESLRRSEIAIKEAQSALPPQPNPYQKRRRLR